MNTQRKNSLLLLLCAFIWGTAFVAQSAGSGMGACSFLAGRSWLAVLVLLPTVKVFDLVRQRSTGTTGAPKTPEERRCLRRASLVCGTLLFVASAAQQFGLTLNPSTAKAGFLTAMYVVLVPIFGLALGRRCICCACRTALAAWNAATWCCCCAPCCSVSRSWR